MSYQSLLTFLQRMAYLIVAGLFVVWAIKAHRPTTEADIKIAEKEAEIAKAKLETTAKLNESRLASMEKRKDCVQSLRQAFPDDFVRDKTSSFNLIVERTCS